MKKRWLIIILVLTVVVMSYGQERRAQRVQATPFPVEWIQPDGDTLVIRIFGDERGSYRTTVDGYVVAENSHGKLCYARKNCRGQYCATCRQAHNASKRTKCEIRYIEKRIERKFIPDDEEMISGEPKDEE
ncbi:MAG: hypothetical protein MJZ95_01595 [Paludibacteraceae bacterium]|nr:hypothetical protein [Paludibacteraceae bacterium]